MSASPASTGPALDIRIKRIDKIYRPGEIVSGVVVVTSKGAFSHQGINLVCEGVVQLQMSSKSVGLFEAFYNSIKPVSMLMATFRWPTGKLPDGTNELPFEFRLEPIPTQQLFETYHGVFVNSAYTIKCDIKRGVMAKDMSKVVEFIVEIPSAEVPKEKPVSFTLTHADFDKRTIAKRAVPNFKMTGALHNAAVDIRKPFTGVLTVSECDAVIKSIELQLVRVETCGCGDGYATEETEIQNIQIADGDIARGMEIPMYMILPRLFTCCTMSSRTFKVEFEVNVVVVYEDNHLISKKFPVTVWRGRD
ncbi:vacuolar protein sorting-associated protein 26 family protein [Pelomyxa schiedti]|nr:vacuolar protein sorting-associated protein 26 family protein [Pelomyxa schiedti]